MTVLLASVLKEGASMATMGWIMGAMMLFFMATMIAWVVWTWLPSRSDEMKANSRLPLEDPQDG